MHLLVAVVVAAFGVAAPDLARQSGAGAAGPRVSACAVLTKDVVLQVTPYQKPALDLVLSVPAEEDSIGKSGSACHYGGITLQIDPFAAPARTEQDLAKTWAPVAGMGDAAYFRDNQGEWAELYVRAGARVLTIQMDVPTGRTAESIRPNVLALAKALLPRLK